MLPNKEHKLGTFIFGAQASAKRAKMRGGGGFCLMGPFRWDSCDTRICDWFCPLRQGFANACSMIFDFWQFRQSITTKILHAVFLSQGSQDMIALIDFE